MSMRDTHAFARNPGCSAAPSWRMRSAALGTLVVGLLLAGPAFAGQWNLIGSRAQAMGGAGVATIEDSTAFYWNPAAFGFKKRGEWDVQLPITVNASVENRVLEQVTDLVFRADDIENVLDAFESGGDLSSITQPQINSTVEWLADLDALGDNPQSVHSEIGVGLLGHVGSFGFGGISNTEATIYPDVDLSNLGIARNAMTTLLGSVVDVPNTPQSDALILEIAGLLDFWDATTAEQLVDAFTIAPNVDPDNAQTAEFIRTLAEGVNSGGAFADNDSGIVTAGLSLQEFGISYGYAIPSPWFKRWLDKKVSVGATAKYMMGIAFVRQAKYVDGIGGSGLGNIDSFSDSKISHNFGLDMGIDYRPLPFARFGIVARNINAPKFDTGTQFGKIKVHPQVRMGTALMPIQNLVLAFDVDLTENQSPTIEGDVPQSAYRSRMISLGSEYTIPMGKPSSLALRFGAYNNMSDAVSNGWALTGGLGLRLWGFWLDLSAGGGLDTERIRVEENKYVNVPDRLNLGLGLKWEKSL